MARPPEGAWYGVNPEHYRTRGADCFRIGGVGWFARMGDKRIRGPLSTLEAAMQAADRMLMEAAKVAACPATKTAGLLASAS